MLGRLFGKKKETFLDKLKCLNNLGIEISSRVSIDDVCDGQPSQSMDDASYYDVISRLSMEADALPDCPQISPQLVSIDLERIEDNGAYVSLVEELAVLVGEDLRIENCRDHIDFETSSASVALSADGKNYDWQLLVDDDWVDPVFFARFAELVRECGCERQLYQLPTDDQTIIVAALQPANISSINKLVQPGFVPLQ